MPSEGVLRLGFLLLLYMTAVGPSREHLTAIDYLKASAIVAVVFTHSGHATFAGAPTEWDLYLTVVWVRFHVPTFLFCSGLLYALAGRADWRKVGSRLTRVLVPYAIATVVAQAAGLTSAKNLADALFQLATASAVGSYYYIFLIAFCIPLIWPLSRMPAGAVWALWAVCLVYMILVVVDPSSWRPNLRLLWSIRNPFENFILGYFLSGWLAALQLPRIVGFWHAYPRLCTSACIAGVVSGWVAFAGGLGPETPMRILYSFAVIAGITLLVRGREPGRIVVFLSEASLALYLYHPLFEAVIRGRIWSWPPMARISTQVIVGLGGATLVALLARRMLGPRRARLLLGA